MTCYTRLWNITEPHLTGIVWTLEDTVGIGIAVCAIRADTWRVVTAHQLVSHITLLALPT